jgi:ribosomal protein S18 acetylase RimI-like enzyme
MRTLPSRTIECGNGRTVVLRIMRPDDAPAVITLTRGILEEGLFAVTDSDEYRPNEQEERTRIEAFLQRPNNLALVAEGEGVVVGKLTFEGETLRRIAHRGILVIFLAPEWRNCGIGRTLMETLIEWASGHPVIEKLCLSVLSTNTPAISLYRKLGFLDEGCLPREVRSRNGDLIDDLRMYRFVKPVVQAGSAAKAGSGPSIA